MSIIFICDICEKETFPKEIKDLEYSKEKLPKGWVAFLFKINSPDLKPLTKEYLACTNKDCKRRLYNAWKQEQ